MHLPEEVDIGLVVYDQNELFTFGPSQPAQFVNEYEGFINEVEYSRKPLNLTNALNYIMLEMMKYKWDTAKHENVVVLIVDDIPDDMDSVGLSHVPSSVRIIPVGIGKGVADALRQIATSPNAVISVKNHKKLFVDVDVKKLVDDICPHWQ